MGWDKMERARCGCARCPPASPKIQNLPRKVTLQLRLLQILRLPWKMTPMADPRHTWNVKYSAQSNRNHPPTSYSSHLGEAFFIETRETQHFAFPLPKFSRNAAPAMKSDAPTSRNTVPATKNNSLIDPRHMSSTTGGETGPTFQHHQILRLPRKVTPQPFLPYSTLLFSTLLYSTRLYDSLLYSTLWFSTLLDSMILSHF